MKKILLLLLILAIPIALSVPDSLTFQGRLVDKDTGEPLGPGPYTLAFILHHEEGGLTPYHNDNVVPDATGAFTVELPFSSELFFENDFEIEIKLDGESLGRTPISSVPYSHTSASVSAGGVKLTDLSLADQIVSPPEGFLEGMIKYEEGDGFFGYHDGDWQSLIGGADEGSTLDNFFEQTTEFLILNSPLKVVGDLTIENGKLISDTLEIYDITFKGDKGYLGFGRDRSNMNVRNQETNGLISFWVKSSQAGFPILTLDPQRGTRVHGDLTVEGNGKIKGILDSVEFYNLRTGTKCESACDPNVCVGGFYIDPPELGKDYFGCDSATGDHHCICMRNKL